MQFCHLASLPDDRYRDIRRSQPDQDDYSSRAGGEQGQTDTGLGAAALDADVGAVIALENRLCNVVGGFSFFDQYRVVGPHRFCELWVQSSNLVLSISYLESDS